MADGASGIGWFLALVGTNGRPAQAFEVELTPDLAKRFLASQIACQRPLRRTRVRKYRRMIASGRWPYTGQGLVFSRSGRMLNGGHTCTAVVEEGKSIPRILVVIDVDDTVFAHMDDVGARSGADNLPTGVANRNAVAAVLNLLWKEERGLIGKTNQMPTSDSPLMLERYPNAQQAVAAAQGCRTLGPVSLMSYGFLRASMVSPEKASEFFTRLANGEMLSKTSPIYLLRDRLIRQKAAKAKLPDLEVLALLIKAWTKFLKDETIGTLRWRADGDAPEPFPVWPGPPLPAPEDA